MPERTYIRLYRSIFYSKLHKMNIIKLISLKIFKSKQSYNKITVKIEEKGCSELKRCKFLCLKLEFNNNGFRLHCSSYFYNPKLAKENLISYHSRIH